MNRSRQHTAIALAAVLTLVPAFSTRAQEIPPIDETPGIPITEIDAEAKDAPLQDNPTLRREWQTGAWGIVAPALRATAMKEGKNHSAKKNAPGPKWVSIGPTGSDFDQNASFTGHVRDSGRARTVLP